MTAPSNVRVNTAAPFPSLVRGVGPIFVSKRNGVWDIGFDASQIGIVIPQQADFPTTYMIVYNSVTGALELVSLSSVISGGGDEPNVDVVTTDDTPTNFPSVVTVLPYQSYTFAGWIVARDTDTGDTSAWYYEGAIKQMADVSTTELVATVTPTITAQDAGAAAWGVTFTANTSTGALDIAAVGEVGRTIAWELHSETGHVTTQPAPPPETFDGVQFLLGEDDSSSFLENSSLTTTDNGFFSFALLFKPNTSDMAPIFSTNFFDFRAPATPGTTCFSFGSALSNTLAFLISDATPHVLAVNTGALATVDQWHTVICSCQTNLGAGSKIVKLYIDDVDKTDFISDPDISFVPSMNGADAVLGTLTFGLDPGVSLAEVWVAPGQSLLTGSDIIEATRRLFFDADGFPVDKGANGEIPTGISPAIYFSGDVSTFSTNLGSGGTFTATGSQITVTGP